MSSRSRPAPFGREDFDRVEAAADLPEPYQVCDAVGEVREFCSAEAASDACIAKLTAAKDQVSVVWDNNAPLIFDLRERGRDGLADALGARYAAALRARYAALSTAPGNEPPETAEAAPAPPGVTQLGGAAVTRLAACRCCCRARSGAAATTGRDTVTAHRRRSASTAGRCRLSARRMRDISTSCGSASGRHGNACNRRSPTTSASCRDGPPRESVGQAPAETFNQA